MPVQNSKNAPIRAFGLAMGEALAVDEGAIFEITAYLARRNETRKDRFPQANEAQEHRISFEASMRPDVVEQ